MVLTLPYMGGADCENRKKGAGRKPADSSARGSSRVCCLSRKMHLEGIIINTGRQYSLFANLRQSVRGGQGPVEYEPDIIRNAGWVG
jgi:hypothetical protein